MPFFLAVFVVVFAFTAQPTLHAEESAPSAYLFKNATLDEFSPGSTLIYEREIENNLLPASAERDRGQIALLLEEGTPQRVTLHLHQEEAQRGLGQFPASVGNPIILFFLETIIRDMAESTGGSPFYIRNRVKEAVANKAELATDTKEGYFTITAPVFKDDPNRARMQGFDALTLTVRMSDKVPGWYESLKAEAAGTEGKIVYRSVITFVSSEEQP